MSTSISRRIMALKTKALGGIGEKTGKATMRGLFKSQKKQSTVDLVVNSIRQLLMTKKLVPGQKIPSENEICDGLGVSRGSVREAMKILAAFGIVEIKVGDGTYIPAEPKPAIIDPLLFSFLIHNPDLEEMMEFRELLELDVVELIIKNKDKNAAERMLLEENHRRQMEMGRLDAEWQALAENDIEFHRIMGRASCNYLVRRIYDFALDFLEATIKGTHKYQEKGEVSIDVHRQILDAIRENDLEVAKKAINYSVNVWRDFQAQENAQAQPELS